MSYSSVLNVLLIIGIALATLGFAVIIPLMFLVFLWKMVIEIVAVSEEHNLGYAKSFLTEEGPKVKLMLRSSDGRIACGCRFKYIEPVIDFNYESLAKALTEAIDKEAEASNGKFVTDEREKVDNTPQSYDYNALMKEFNDIVGALIAKDKDANAPRITQIIEKYLGKGKKISETTLDQAEFVYLIVNEIKDELVK